MNETWRQVVRVGLLAGALVAGLVASRPVTAQGGGNPPDWIQDVFSVRNRYLVLFEYFQDSDISRFDVWHNDGDPRNPLDNFFFLPNPPWGSRLFSAPHPPYGQSNPDTRPFCNLVTVRVDDASQPSGFRDLSFPEDGAQTISPAIIPLARDQGFSAPFRFDNTLIVDQKTEFARDLIRVEFVVRNEGPTARRVGIRAVLDPFVDHGFSRVSSTNPEPTRSIFFPRTGQRVFMEADWGARVGTTVTPRNGSVPDEWLVFDDDESPTPNYIAKGILRGLGATPPDRFMVANSLNLFPAPGGWDYPPPGRRPQELRISDIATVLWWAPVSIPAGGARSFVTYIGVGVASHEASDSYIATQRQLINERPGTGEPSRPQGFVAALQTPFAVPLVDGNADGQSFFADVSAQNVALYDVPGFFAFMELPPALRFAGSGQTSRQEIGGLGAVGGAMPDEGTVTWNLEPTGVEAGMVPLRVTVGNGLLDSAQVTRYVNVPQGRLYQFGAEWRMFTFPFTYPSGNNDPSQLFVDANGNPLPSGALQIVRYNPQNTVTPYEQVNFIQPGEGYWIRALNVNPGESLFVRLREGEPVRLGGTGGNRQLFTTVLKNGWNQVGNASPYAVRLADLQFLVQRGGAWQLVDWTTAVSAGYVRPAIFEWDWRRQRYVSLPLDTFIQPGRGIWIYANGERVLAWPAPYGPGIEYRTTGG